MQIRSHTPLIRPSAPLNAKRNAPKFAGKKPSQVTRREFAKLGLGLGLSFILSPIASLLSGCGFLDPDPQTVNAFKKNPNINHNSGGVLDIEAQAFTSILGNLRLPSGVEQNVQRLLNNTSLLWADKANLLAGLTVAKQNGSSIPGNIAERWGWLRTAAEKAGIPDTTWVTIKTLGPEGVKTIKSLNDAQQAAEAEKQRMDSNKADNTPSVGSPPATALTPDEQKLREQIEAQSVPLRQQAAPAAAPPAGDVSAKVAQARINLAREASENVKYTTSMWCYEAVGNAIERFMGATYVKFSQYANPRIVPRSDKAIKDLDWYRTQPWLQEVDIGSDPNKTQKGDIMLYSPDPGSGIAGMAEWGHAAISDGNGMQASWFYGQHLPTSSKIYCFRVIGLPPGYDPHRYDAEKLSSVRSRGQFLGLNRLRRALTA